MMKYPGAEIAFWSLAFICVATAGTYNLVADGKILFGCIGAILPVGCVLVWFDIRSAKWLVAGYLACSGLAACWMLVSQGWRLELALIVGLAAYVAYRFAAWDGRPEAGLPAA